MAPYDFNKQNAIGKRGEEVIWRWLGKFYRLSPASMAQQRRGIDAIGTHKILGEVESFEVKTDTYGSDRIFIETVANDVTQKQGWAYTCTADWLLYYLKKRGEVLMLRPLRLRRELPQWEHCASATIPNRTYNTIGLLVPRWRVVRVVDAIVGVG